MSLLIYFTLASVMGGALALNMHVQETGVADSHLARGLSPRPTSGPFAAKAEFKRGSDIFARSTKSATCGFVSKDYFNAVTCNAGYGCGFIPTNPDASKSFSFTQGAVECCPITAGGLDFNDCQVAKACSNYSPQLNTLANPVFVSGTILCGYGEKSCATWVFEDTPPGISGSATAQVYTHLFCATEAITQAIYAEVTNAPSSASASLSTSLANVAGSSAIAPDITNAHTHVASAAASGPAHQKSSGGSNNVAAIAGGTVGGIAALALIGAIVGVLVWRKRKSRMAPPEVSTKEYYTT